MDSYSPSLLDKLLGHDGPGRDGASLRFSVEQVKDSVARDIEMLLNAHAAYEPHQLASLPLAAESILPLGLIDISAMSLASDNDRRRITDAIRNALSTHDKRLTQVEVKVREACGANATLTFSIRANLILRPNSEPVSFDAVLQPGSKRYEVSKTDPRAKLAA